LVLETSSDPKEISVLCEKLMKSLETIQHLNFKEDDQIQMLHENGLKLWNLVIGKRLSKKVQRTSVAQG
jgi:hypothetical protein